MDFRQFQCSLAVLPQKVTSYPETKSTVLPQDSLLSSLTYATQVTESTNKPFYPSPRIRKHPEYQDIRCVIIKRNGRFILSRRLQPTHEYLEKTWAGAFISLARHV